MSATSAAYFARRTANLEDAIAYQIDRSQGNAKAWSRDPDDADFVPRSPTSFRRNVGGFVTPAAAPVEQPRKALPTRHSAATVRKPAKAVVDTAALEAEQVRLAALEAERQAAEAAAREAELVRQDEARMMAAAEAEEATLCTERAWLISDMQVVDMEVFEAMWPERGYSRWRILDWVQTISDIDVLHQVRRSLDNETAKHAEAKAEARRAEIARLHREAAEERERLAKPANGTAVANLANAFGQKQERNGTPKSGGKKSRSTGVSLEELRRLSTARMPVATTAPTKAELEKIEHRINGTRPAYHYAAEPVSATPRKKSDLEIAAEAQRNEQEAFLNRVRGLSPATVARLHRDSSIRNTWPSIERMLELLKTRSGCFNGEMATKMEVFIARCEQG